MFSAPFNTSPLSALLQQLFQGWINAAPATPTARGGSDTVIQRKSSGQAHSPYVTARHTPRALADGAVFEMQHRYFRKHATMTMPGQGWHHSGYQDRTGQQPSDVAADVPPHMHHASRHGTSPEATDTPPAAPATQQPPAQEAETKPSLPAQSHPNDSEGKTVGGAHAQEQITAAAQKANGAAEAGQDGLSVALDALNRVADRIHRGETISQTLLNEVVTETARATATTTTSDSSEAQARAAAQAYRDTNIMLAPVRQIQEVAANWSGQQQGSPDPSRSTAPADLTGLTALTPNQIATLQHRVDRMLGRLSA